MDAVLHINASFGAQAAKEVQGDLESKVKASMSAVIEKNWMATNDDDLFRAGLAGALSAVGADSEDGQRLIRSIDHLRKFTAAMAAATAGVPVDFSNLVPTDGEENPLPLIGWWHEVKGSK